MELHDGNLTAEEIKFLQEFPEWKKEQEKYITTLRAFADDADKMHKKFTKSKVVSSSVTVASEVANIVGLALVPVTAGASLLLSTASKGVSAAAVVSTMVTEFREKSHNKKLRAQASIQVPVGDHEPKEPAEKQSAHLSPAGQALYRCGRALQVIKKGIRALWPIKTQPHSGTSVKHHRTSGKVSGAARTQIAKSSPGKALTVAKLARMSVRAFASMSLNEGMSALWKNWKQLRDESKAELAEELRAQARELEEVLEQYSKCYDALLKKGTNQYLCTEINLKDPMQGGLQADVCMALKRVVRVFDDDDDFDLGRMNQNSCDSQMEQESTDTGTGNADLLDSDDQKTPAMRVHI
ncbi:apolipoprotein L6-like [Octodon degus]|uniref:Apolipoprotein L6-like n=1 Tax=Octodon degus TaxID=10160 RepID=A0A6P3VBC3_OCTDE|nr:apolipoprotein L6-like [Octodon degus]